MKTFLIFSFLLFSTFVYAQVRTIVYPNENDLFRLHPELKMDSRSIPLKKMSSFDVEKLLAEDREMEDAENFSLKPFRFGYGFGVNYTLNDGVWETTEIREVGGERTNDRKSLVLSGKFKNQ